MPIGSLKRVQVPREFYEALVAYIFERNFERDREIISCRSPIKLCGILVEVETEPVLCS